MIHKIYDFTKSAFKNPIRSTVSYWIPPSIFASPNESPKRITLDLPLNFVS